MSNQSEAIGGYFGLEQPNGVNVLHRDCSTFQSARAAFCQLLMHYRPNKVWMPEYICDAMLAPLKVTGTEVSFYSLTETFDLSPSVSPGNNDWLLYVNYFGLCHQQEASVATRLAPDQLVLDRAQAFYAPSSDCLACIYSPRKFFGLPDGGLLSSLEPIQLPKSIDTGSRQRIRHLNRRLTEEPEAGYDDYRKAEGSLDDPTPMKMSAFTSETLASTDTETARVRRNQNFQFLHEELGKLNLFPIPEHADGPLCYPFLSKINGIREKLIAKRIFVPNYWQEVRERVESNSFEAFCVSNLVALPCDQRYNQNDMSKILEVLECLI